MNLTLVPRHLQASLSYHPVEAKREGSQALVILHHWHTLYISLKVKCGKLISNMKASSWSIPISCSESWLCHAPRGRLVLVIGAPLQPAWNFGWAERSGVWWTKGCLTGRCMAVCGICQRLAFYLDELQTSQIECSNKTQKGSFHGCVCLHFDSCFTWPPLHDSENLSAVGVPKIQKE